MIDWLFPKGLPDLRQFTLALTLLSLSPLIVLAWWKKVFPHTPMLYVLLAPCALALLVIFRPETIALVAVADFLILGLAIFDLYSLPQAADFFAERKVGRIASLKSRHSIELTVANQAERPCYLWVRDDLPAAFESDVDEFVLELNPRRKAVLNYQVQPKRRGAVVLENVYLCARSRWGLWKRYLTLPAQTTVHVYPDMKQLAEYAVLARTNRLSLIGVRRTRRVGQDNEFERLRDYTRDDNYRNIEWRSTARRRKLTVKDFQTNQSQRIIFLLDCGRMMTNQVQGLSLLDHAINSALMLSYVALRQGDSVGLICFSDRVHSYTPPRGSMSQMNRLLHASYDRFPQLVESRYDQAFLYLGAHCARRALVVLITNVIDSVNSMQIQQHVCNLAGRHLPLCVLLRDRQLFDAVEHTQGGNIFRAAAAADILSWRRQVLTDMEYRGVLTLDVFPEEMTSKLVNQYLEVKARHLL